MSHRGVSRDVGYGALVARFSERMGFVKVRSVIQVNDLDDGTRVELWNACYPYVQANTEPNAIKTWTERDLSRYTWTELLGLPIDELYRCSYPNFILVLKEIVLAGDFYKCLDLVEFLVLFESLMRKDELKPRFNGIFSRNLVGYRFVGNKIVPVTDEVELAEVETAQENTASNVGAAAHLRNAITLLADRTSPDYANSIKEAMSAVESTMRERTGKTTLSAALKEIEKRGGRIHPALSEGWQKLYAYTGDGDGIRHGSMKESEATEALASYFLVTGSSFINYITKVLSD